MNIAIIFAGGVGSRMNTKAKPKQFLELHGKAIIIHTIELFENHPGIDGIVISCVAEWIDYLKELLDKFNIKKVVDIVPGGETGQMSIYNGLSAAEKHFPSDSVVLIHDGVRPLINKQIISDNIRQVKKSGSAITTAPTVETFVVIDENYSVTEIPKRALSKLAKAPQSFILADILAVHQQAQKDQIFDSIDSCTLMSMYHKPLTLVEGPVENIKITTPTDYFIFRAIYEARENNQIYGLEE
ncbi:2-C-methyl-D-erythritol 4-phosphate cytidylyltransferase [Mangrovibacterium marinum]|uniref:Ribitol-5-phosphate cytidylyltransferase n=1 Tax=Mangrovibacterium marinum TaxID=1639118 RepID=A0A2T5C6A7_9BACT|nr:IspD/TarI family cytidylyltransferase [Mangrovibacterium marinum]PTN10485.1 2-C-methyl-D-erythritol 4-phosphate cytidylyltransferase [Mangrovibacterium marinum]